MLFRYYSLNVAALVLAVWNLSELEFYFIFYLLFIYIFFSGPLPKFDLLYRNKRLWQFFFKK